MTENTIKQTKDTTPAPYDELFKMLHELGYHIEKFKNITKEPKDFSDIPSEKYELIIVKS